MDAHILNYRIIIEPEITSGKTVYNAYCPKLGVADWGKSIEQAKLHIREAIECHLESLVKHHQPIPTPDQSEFMITTTQIDLGRDFNPTFAY